MLVILAMSAALLFRGGELLVSEAAISAILLASLEPTSSGFSADRILEGLIGGGVGLAVASFLLPPDPVSMVGQVAQTVFGKLGRTLEETATALQDNDPVRAESALQAARGIDEDVEALERILGVASETARFAPARRGGLPHVQRYEQAMPQIDFAVRDTRVLVRYAARQVRAGEQAPQLAGAVRELADAVWVLAAQYEQPDRPTALRELALHAARSAEDIHDREPSLMTTQVVAQVRSVAVDLVRAAESLIGEDRAEWELPTEELLARARRRSAAPRPAALKLLQSVEATAPGSGSSCSSTRSTHLTHSKPRRPGTTSRHGAPWRGSAARRRRAWPAAARARAPGRSSSGSPCARSRARAGLRRDARVVEQPAQQHAAPALRRVEAAGAVERGDQLVAAVELRGAQGALDLARDRQRPAVARRPAAAGRPPTTSPGSRCR